MELIIAYTIGNFVYGLPISLFSEYITKSMEGRQDLLLEKKDVYKAAKAFRLNNSSPSLCSLFIISF